MIDIHCHILPNIDDGASNIELAIMMAEEAVSEGITHILATPHHKNGKFLNYKKEILLKTEQFQNELNLREIPLKIFPGQEVRLHGEIIECIENDDIIFADEQNKYLLIEFPTQSIPSYTDQLFFQLMQRDITPIIVHPERNREVIDNPKKLLELVEKGALSQITAGSYIGQFGKEIAKITTQLIESNLTHVIASDAHNVRGRSFNMLAAMAKLEKEFGRGKVNEYKENAKNIINGDFVYSEGPIDLKYKNKFWSLFKK